MQDIHSIGGGGGVGGGGGRIFGGGGGDRRLRPHHHQNQALKCPRCDSLNTKFCYYNNYNLSQPRHFCKSCRRYWTKGGVLRNVPVGGGCRKTKRSKPKPSSAAAAAADDSHKSNSHSSSESSTLTATTTATTTTTAPTPTTIVLSTTCGGGGGGNLGSDNVKDSVSATCSSLFSLPESRLFTLPQHPTLTTNSNFEPALIDNATDGGIFTEIGSFTSLMTSSSGDPTVLGFNVPEISPFSVQQQSQQFQGQKMVMNMSGDEVKMHEITAGFLDQTVQVELSGLQSRSNGGGFAPLDWQGGDQGLFDLPGTVDQAYWNQSQWSDNDHSLYLP